MGFSLLRARGGRNNKPPAMRVVIILLSLGNGKAVGCSSTQTAENFRTFCNKGFDKAKSLWKRRDGGVGEGRGNLSPERFPLPSPNLIPYFKDFQRYRIPDEGWFLWLEERGVPFLFKKARVYLYFCVAGR